MTFFGKRNIWERFLGCGSAGNSSRKFEDFKEGI